MKEYINERLTELRKEKDMWLLKLETNENDEVARISYLNAIAKIDEVLDFQIEAIKKGWY